MSVSVFLLTQSYMLKECEWYIDGIIVWKGHDWNLILNIEFHVGLIFINNCTAGNANESLDKVMVNIPLSKLFIGWL